MRQWRANEKEKLKGNRQRKEKRKGWGAVIWEEPADRIWFYRDRCPKGSLGISKDHVQSRDV